MFHPDGLLIRFLTKVCDLLLLNLALVLSCVTVVFSGTAVTSLYTVDTENDPGAGLHTYQRLPTGT